jgi:hypothetical protein
LWSRRHCLWWRERLCFEGCRRWRLARGCLGLLPEQHGSSKKNRERTDRRREQLHANLPDSLSAWVILYWSSACIGHRRAIHLYLTRSAKGAERASHRAITSGRRRYNRLIFESPESGCGFSPTTPCEAIVDFYYYVSRGNAKDGHASVGRKDSVRHGFEVRIQ